MLRLFKKKYAYPEVKCPRNAREMTDEEMLLVNGGSERRENSHEGVANANVGDTIQRNDGTVVTLNQGDIDYAKNQLGISDSGSGTSVSGSVGGSGSSVGGSGVGSSGSPADTAPKVDLQKKPQIDHQRNTELMDGWYGNSYISYIEKNKKNVIGGKKVEEKEIKVNQGAGNMTVSDYIDQQRKKGTGTTVSGQTVGGVFGGENTASVKTMGGTTINSNGHSHHSGQINASEDAICWDQVGAGALDMVFGIGGIVGGGIVVSHGGGVAPMGYIAAKEGITLFCYGMAEFGSGLQGNRIPNSLNLTIEQYTFGLAETDFDRWGQQ